MEIWEVEEGQTPIEGLLDDGSPDPSYAAALGLVQAPLDRRAKAFAVECAIYLVLQVPMWILMVPLLLKFLTGRISGYGFVNHPDFKLAAILAGVTVVLTLGYSIAQLALHGSKGVTLGKALFGIRSVNVRTLEKPGLGKVFLRAIVVWGASVVPFGSIVVLASPLFKSAERGRGWQDKVGQNWLIDIRNGLDPYDEKRMRIARKTQAAAPRAERSELPSLTDVPGRSGAAFYQPGSRLSAGVLGRAEQATAGGALATPAGAPPSTPAPPTRPTAVTPPPAPAPAPAPQAPARPVTPPVPPVPPAPPAPPAAPVPAAPVAPSAPPAPAPQVPAQPVTPPAPPAPAPAAAPAPAPTPSPAPAPAPAPAPSPASAPAPAFVLHVDTGEQIRVEGAVIIGRSPTPPVGTEAQPVVIIDELLSRTHLLVRQVDGGLELTDCGSSNGTAVTHQGVTRQLVAQQPSQAGPDDTIQIGQRTATVRRA